MNDLEILAAFDQPVTSTTTFTLDDEVYGLLDSTTVGLATASTNIVTDAYHVAIQRGRSAAIFETIPAGTATVHLENMDRRYDPTYTLSPYQGQIVPSKHVTINMDGVTIFDGRVQDWNYQYDIDTMSSATATLIDALGVLGSQEFDEWVSTGGELTGSRINTILDRPEVNWSAARNIDGGNTTLQSDTVSWGSNVLNYAQLVAQSELGYLFAARDGALTFQDRYTGFNTTPIAFFDDRDENLPFWGITTSYGSELLYTRVGVDRENGIKQTVSDEDAALVYGWKSLSLSGLLMDSDEQAADMATYLAGIYKTPQFRIEQITVHLHALSYAQRVEVLTLDIGDVVRVEFTPDGIGSPIDQILVIQGVEHDITPFTHTLVFTLALAGANLDAFRVLTLDDDVFGLLDDYDETEDIDGGTPASTGATDVDGGSLVTAGTSVDGGTPDAPVANVDGGTAAAGTATVVDGGTPAAASGTTTPDPSTPIDLDGNDPTPAATEHNVLGF